MRLSQIPPPNFAPASHPKLHHRLPPAPLNHPHQPPNQQAHYLSTIGPVKSHAAR
ncbi:hypothetical protein K505DRAFT_325354 [Melanomma pulvis-pyrius CBS 109.77]|uniref:Uncharacterized protein n=1 Tax=Melanomma pulvis-pyrius CBS 109.77 TaxID=1314802 RepID=A0A6A6XB47_9PLEO|nr:hypothetical protein K505DRAFT_325354 [Melanomma pulvis-pyrius CBS 109.77]